ncbi:type II toxin-antitoxin system RelB/DinJ family antitoxin [Vampirovibrio sp.]|uniref:type II toxin-antitoxin system RelB/DinJ family antitoxin n=1 Tax=Vampirovibrio sp. TaxID=2717857 RepID=UPI00359451D5
MPKDAFIRARTTVDLKERVETILARLGMNTSDAINLFFHQVELHNGLPFEVKLPNAETLSALNDLEKNRDVTISSLAEFKQSLE